MNTATAKRPSTVSAINDLADIVEAIQALQDRLTNMDAKHRANDGCLLAIGIASCGARNMNVLLSCAAREGFETIDHLREEVS